MEAPQPETHLTESVMDASIHGPSREEIRLATWAHGAGILTSFTGFGFIAPLIILRLSESRQLFARQEAQEALNFQLTVALALFVCLLLLVVVVGFALIPVLWVWSFVFSALAALSARKGQAYRYPLNIVFIRRL